MTTFCVNPAERMVGHEHELPVTSTNMGVALVEAENRQHVATVLGGENHRTSILPYGKKLRGAMTKHPEEFGLDAVS